jgi:hypothetical protein
LKGEKWNADLPKPSRVISLFLHTWNLPKYCL